MAAERIIRRDPTGWRVESLASDDDEARFQDLDEAIAFCRGLGVAYEIDDAGARIGGDGRDVMPDSERDARVPR